MPVLPCHTGHSAGLGMLHDEARGWVEAEFLAQHGDHLTELVALHFHLGGDDEMPHSIGASEPACIGHGVLKVGNRALHGFNRLVVLAIHQMSGQCARTTGGPEACSLDQHDQRPNSIWASTRACTRSSVRPWRASMELMRRRSDATA